MSDFLRDDEAIRERGEWFIELYITAPNGDPEVLRYSRRGTTTKRAITIGDDTIPALTRFSKRLLDPPATSQELWGNSQLFGRTLPSLSEMVLANDDRALDRYRPKTGYKVAGGRGKVFFADIADIQGTIVKIFDGKLLLPHWNSENVSVGIAGKELDFDVPLSSRVYRGTSYQLELLGDRTVSYGTPSVVNITGSLTIEGWLWLEALPSSGVAYWGWVGGTTYPWQMIVRSGGNLALQATISGTPESKISSAALGLHKPYHFAWIVEGATVTYLLWDDDAQVLTTETLSNFSSGTRQGNSGGTYVLRSASLNPFTPWSDDFRVWNVARTAAEIAADRHRPFSASTVPVECVHYTPFDDGAGTHVTDLSLTAAHGTISGAGSSTYIWAMEGGPELAGIAKDDLWGPNFGVAPKLVDPIRQVYQVAGNGRVHSIVSQEGGNPHTMDANAASLRSLAVTGPTVSGHSQPYRERGLFRLKDQPTLPVSATVEGYDDGPLGYVNTPASITRDIITRRGPKLADPGDLDTDSFDDYEAKINNAITGVRSSGSDDIRAAIDYAQRSGAGWWGYILPSEKFHIRHFAAPSGTADFHQTKIIDANDIILDQGYIYEVVVRYRPNSTVLSEDQVAAAVKGTAGWQEWTMPCQLQKATDHQLRSDYPGDATNRMVIDTGLWYQEDARTLANYLLKHLGGVREPLTVILPFSGMDANIGQTETLTYAYQDGTNVLGLDGTNLYLIFGRTHNRRDGTVEHKVWR